MKKFFVIAAITLSACQTNRPETIEWADNDLSKSKPGTVLTQSIRKGLGNSFYDVSKSIVNAPDHWEGIAHLGYIYYKNTEVCQCSQRQRLFRQMELISYIFRTKTIVWKFLTLVRNLSQHSPKNSLDLQCLLFGT